MGKPISISEIDILLGKLRESPLAKTKISDLEIEKMVKKLSGIGAKKASDAVKAKQMLTAEIEWILQEWENWKLRAEIYAPLNIPLDATSKEKNEIQSFNHYFREFHALEESEQIKNILRKAKLALQAFFEQPSGATFDEAKIVILGALIVEIKKLQIAQLEILENKQQFRRSELRQQANKFKEEKLLLASLIEKRPKRFSKEMTNKDYSYKFFKSREKRIHVNRHLEDTNKVSLIMQTIVGAILKLYHFIPALFHPIMAVINILPIISPITIIYPKLVAAVKTWLKRKDAKTIAITTGLFAFLTGSIILSGLLPVAAAAIAAGVVITSTTILYFVPWLKLVIERKKRQKNLAICDKELVNLESNLSFPLSRIQKQTLLSKLEGASSKTPLTKNAYISLQKTRQAIISSNEEDISDSQINKIINNPWVQKTIQESNKTNFNEYMKHELIQYREVVSQDIKVLKNEERIAGIALFGSVLAIVGAVLFCIPTPATIGVGALLYFISGIIAAALEFKWIDKLMGDPIKSKTQPLLSFAKSMNSTSNTTLRVTHKQIKTVEADLEYQVYPPVLTAKEIISPMKPNVMPTLEDAKQHPLTNNLKPSTKK